jgi:hypothetical protein
MYVNIYKLAMLQNIIMRPKPGAGSTIHFQLIIYLSAFGVLAPIAGIAPGPASYRYTSHLSPIYIHA